MVGLTRFEVYLSVFNTTEENNKFDLYRYLVDAFSFTEIKVELEEIPNVSKIPPELVKAKIIGSCILKAYKKQKSGKRRTDGYYQLLMG